MESRELVKGNHVPLEMLSVSDGLRHCRWTLAVLVHRGMLSRLDDNVDTVLSYALAVSDALEKLAQQMAQENSN